MAVFVFLGYLAAGLAGSLAVVRLGPAGRKFFLFNGALTLVVGATALALRLLGPARWGWGEGVRMGATAAGLAFAGLAILAGYLVATAVAGEPRLFLRVAALLLLA